MTTYLICIGDRLFYTDSRQDLPVPNCQCVRLVDEAMAPENGKLGICFVGNDQGGCSPTMFARKLNSIGAMPPIVIPQFCPFCGTRYGDQAAGAEQPDTPAPAAISSADTGHDQPDLADRVGRLEARIGTLERFSLSADARLAAAERRLPHLAVA